MVGCLGFVGGCTTIYEAPAIPGPDMAPALYAAPVLDEYQLQIGDQLSIRSYYDSYLNQDVTIRPDGRISVILLGEIPTAGLTPEQLQNLLATRYTAILDSPDIAVIVKQTADSQVFIGGEVASPTVVPMTGSLTLRQAITAAGGAQPTADLKQVLIMRKDDSGNVVASKVDLASALVSNSPDLFLRRHDLVFLPKSGIAIAGDYVDLYVNRLVPRSILFQFGFITQLDDDDNSTTVTVPATASP